ncbi:MAG: HEAT repeat domain-containing protein [Clostridiaceae bacterium]|nr:HEAT repeat domain-containing protein [Clostridiaceae bacterium]
MEQYVYYSIIFFAGFIFFLYIYILFEKTVNSYELRKRTKYEKELLPYIDNILLKMEEQYPTYKTVEIIKVKIKNSIKRKILIDRVQYFTSVFSGEIRVNIIKFCEETKLLDSVLKDLKSKDHKKIALSCKILGEFRSKKAISYLLKALDKKSPDVQYNALMALAKVGDMHGLITAFTKLNRNNILSERSLIEIVDSFEGDKIPLYYEMILNEDPYISSIFIKSVGNHMDLTLNEIIAAFLKEENLDRKIAAIKVIGQTVDIRFIEDLIECMEDESWQVRSVTAKSLGKLADVKAIPALVSALNDREWWVRYNSAQAIFMMPNEINKIETVFLAQDAFAKDSLLSAMENSGVFADLYRYEYSTDDNKRNLAKLINDYINKSEVGDTKNAV